MFRRDFLMRELERMLDGIAAVMKKHREGDTTLALATLGDLYDELLAEHRPMLDHTDARTMATLLAAAERAAGLAHLVAAESDLREDTPTEALLLKAKATELMLEAIEMGYDDDGEVEAWAVPDVLLSERARALKAQHDIPTTSS